MKSIVLVVCTGWLVVGCGGSRVDRYRAPAAEPVLTNSGSSCRLLESWSAAPLEISAPHGKIEVAIAASDVNGGGRFTYLWKATAGGFVDTAASATAYLCTTPGEQTVTGTVFDNHSQDYCHESVDFRVICKATGL